MRAALIAVFVVLCGCSGGSAATRYYVLTPTDETAAAKRDVSVVVTGVRMPQYLDRSQIVTRDGANRLQVSDDEQWGGNLRQDLTRVLAENLGRLLGSERIAVAPQSVRAPDFRLEVEILRFERAADGRVQLAAKWWLTSGDGTPLASPTTALAGPVVALAEGKAFDPLVASMSALFNQLCSAIAADIGARSGK